MKHMNFMFIIINIILSPGIVSLSISTGLNSVINILKYKIFVQNFSLILKMNMKLKLHG